MGISPGYKAIIAEALRRGYKVEDLEIGGVVQITSPSRVARILGTVTDRTSHLAYTLAGDKHATKKILIDHGISVPFGFLARSVEEAVAYADTVDGPIVMKPNLGHKGKGVRVCLRGRDSIAEAFDHIRSLNAGEVLVEEFVEGADVRLLVVDGECIAAAQRCPPSVLGDGVRTIAELVAEKRDQKRHGIGNDLLAPNGDLVFELREQGLDLSYKPKAGENIQFRLISSVSLGSEYEDISGKVAISAKKAAAISAQIIGLDLAGIDMRLSDYASEESKFSIIEVNSSPGLNIHSIDEPHRAEFIANRILDYVTG